MKPLDLAVRLFDRYESLQSVRHYYGILAIYGLCRVAEYTAESTGDSSLMNRCCDVLARFPDHIQHSNYNFPSYKIGGIARAYALLRGIDPNAREMVRYYADEMMTAARDARGILKNPHDPDKNLIWIDVAMAATPYLLFSGLALKEDRYIDEAARQAFLMYDEFWRDDTGLLHQSKNFNGVGCYSEDHWSRGNGWGYIALTELIQYLPAGSPHRQKAEDYFKRHSQAILKYQNSRGLWRQEMTLDSAWEESSGTGLFLYGFGVGMRMGILDQAIYTPAFELGISGICRYCICDDMTTLHTCCGCLCPGQGEQKGTIYSYLNAVSARPNDEHSWGPLILALSEAYRAGISVVEVGAKAQSV